MRNSFLGRPVVSRISLIAACIALAWLKPASVFANDLPVVQTVARDVMIREFQFNGNAVISTAELQGMRRSAVAANPCLLRLRVLVPACMSPLLVVVRLGTRVRSLDIAVGADSTRAPVRARI